MANGHCVHPQFEFELQFRVAVNNAHPVKKTLRPTDVPFEHSLSSTLGVPSGGQQIWYLNVEPNYPYLHPAIIKTIKQGFFATSNSTAARYIDDFPVVKGKCHLPAPMLVLAATAGNIFSGIYRGHMLALSKMLDTSVKTFNRVMSTVFDLTGGLSEIDYAAGGGAFAVMDLEDDDDDDEAA
ncbi:hypothetical protein BKA70DRAFT_1481409 [Coprinopsis sp. MPI-PUGE-AT-0042]|nr:hypothetical protein BKA70DRAFT_1481409 [Coprinopsis sp. MPI-PUGE-AT-0042]